MEALSEGFLQEAGITMRVQRELSIVRKQGRESQIIGKTDGEKAARKAPELEGFVKTVAQGWRGCLRGVV